MELRISWSWSLRLRYWSGAGDLRGMFDPSGNEGEMPSSSGVQAELGLEKKESQVGTVLPPGARKDKS